MATILGRVTNYSFCGTTLDLELNQLSALSVYTCIPGYCLHFLYCCLAAFEYQAPTYSFCTIYPVTVAILADTFNFCSTTRLQLGIPATIYNFRALTGL
jgi:hypothetical protein